MSIRYRETAAVTLASLASAVATGVAFAPAATADARIAGAPAGRVCMFDAPKGALTLGHVGWAFRWSDGSWGYGATMEDHNWQKHGSEQQMLHDFATSNDSGGYRSYRCTNTAADNEGSAESAVTAGFARTYNVLDDNCLTRSIQIFKAYDGSGGLNRLSDGKLIFPNAYFNYDLTGWENAAPL